jgi:hypothetical protein
MAPAATAPAAAGNEFYPKKGGTKAIVCKQPQFRLVHEKLKLQKKN